MKVRLFIIAAILGVALFLPISAQIRPGDAEDVTVIDVVADHEQISEVYKPFGSDFADFLGGETELDRYRALPLGRAFLSVRPAVRTHWGGESPQQARPYLVST